MHRAVWLCILGLAGLGSPGPAQANPPVDWTYRALLEAQPGVRTLPVDGLLLRKDVLEIHLDAGRLDFAEPVAGRNWLVVFQGTGRLRLTPATSVERDQLRRLTADPTLEVLEESFTGAVFQVTDGSFDAQVAAALPANPEPRSRADLDRFRFLMHEHAGLHPELKVLASWESQGVFLAAFFGQRWPHLLYVLDPRGVDPGRFGPEESGLYNATERPGNGWWYLAHQRDEAQQDERHIQSLNADFVPLHYRIDTRIGADEGLESVARIRLRATAGAGRVLSFQLSRRLWLREALLLPRHTPLAVVQESRDWSDPNLGIVLPESLPAGALVELELRYLGRGVVAEQADGSFLVGARANWIPTQGLFHPRASYELGFCVPAGLEVVSVGQLLRQWMTDQAENCSEWLSTVPLTMAGFNYGRFRKLERQDRDSGLTLGVYTRQEGAEARHVLAGAVQSARLYTRAFGPPAFTHVSITEQPSPAFGQAWPSLVYLPPSAFPGGAQRCGSSATTAPAVAQAHEMAHQWWGHTVGWATYHDEWLTEGLADFAAAWMLEKTQGRDCFEDFWRQSREALAGTAEVGPLWLGRRLENHRNRRAYGAFLYPKGSYVFHMLRMMMQSEPAGDEAFLNLLRQFTAQYRNRRSSTADFQRLLEAHTTPEMDLEGTGSMDWFFRQWVYGTQRPDYKLETRIDPDGGQWRLRGTLQQTGVPEDFRMLVPLYADFGGGRLTRVARLAVLGTQPVALDLPLPGPEPPLRIVPNAHFDILTAP